MDIKNRFLFIVNDINFFISHRIAIANHLLSRGDSEIYIAGNIIDYKILNNKDISKNIKFINLNMSRSGLNLFKELLTIIKIFYLIRKIKPDILHLITLKPVIYGMFLSNFYKIKKVVNSITGLGYSFSDQPNLKQMIIKKIIIFLLKISINYKKTIFIFQNTNDLNILNNIFNKKLSTILIEGSGVKISDYLFNINHSHREINVLMACRLIKEKGVFEYYQVAKKLKKKYSNVNFILAGDLDKLNPSSLSNNDLDEIIDSGFIDYIGYERDIKKILIKTNIATLPSFYSEGLPKFLIECSVAGIPIVTTDMPGCKSAIINEQTGLLIKPRNVEQLSDALERLINDSDLRKKMSANARIFGSKKFDIDLVIKKHLECYNILN